MNCMTARLLILLWAFPSLTLAQAPVIDIHLHAYPALPPQSDPIWQALPRHVALQAPRGAEEHFAATLEQMDRHNIVLGVVSGPAAAVRAWKTATPTRFIGGAWLFVDGDLRPSVDDLQRNVEQGMYSVLGELNLQYQGVSPADPRLEPYYGLAESRGLPVGLHSSGGPPGAPYYHDSRFRVSLGDPILLEPVLLRHPRLKVYLMHAGHPFLERTKAILGIYPQVYVDVGAISWVLPREEFYGYLSALMEAGFGERVMFGSDQVFWPGAITLAIEAIEMAPFLTPEQKRNIFYNNAARFLGLSEEVIAKHHGR
jgi:hypothetical protein